MAPTRIAGRYELQNQLGEGGMGVVWQALDTRIGSCVAVKVMKDVSDPVAVELFEKEWKALAEMCHPNIVDVRDVDVIEEDRKKRPFFVMPLLRGATLAELIANASARLTLARTVEIITQVCRGLQAAHQRGLVHRDLKPSNIFVMEDDTAKIIDFGVVHLAGSKSVTGQKGTFQYMSPEQAQLKEVTPASDLFSLGVILYEALTLRKPFARPTIEETVEAVIKYVPPPVSEINPSINQSISKVIHKCLAKQPIHRFTSARELAETLQKAFRGEPVFDSAKIDPRIERAKTEFKSGDPNFASEILAELEAEGHLDPRITVLRMQVDLAVKEKKVRQLIEGARARLEQEEIPLALDKLREALELDPENTDALSLRQSIEKQRSETQITKWFELAQTHLENRDFGAARHAVQELLAIRSGDRRALELLQKIESTEADSRRVRDQKEQLYSSALRAYQNGEIESALSKLERLFSVARANPNAAVPQRDAVYQSFYKEVRSERDDIRGALEEAQRQFSEKNFAGAMTICRELMAKYPNDGTFQALKIRIEDAERQELSAYIADVSKQVESEPDLDRRANILREASERYPNEAQFAQQLKVVRERRDLVNSIVAKARQYEERGQYAEAISQWDILRNIHPRYPGIAFELEECRKKRDRQVREEDRAHQVEEIDAYISSRNFAEALRRVDIALEEFPGDAELSGLRTLAEQGSQRTDEARRLFEEGQRAMAEKDFPRATDLLRSGYRLDARSPGLRETLINVLVERARVLVDDKWDEAEPLYQEASQLDSTYPAVRALRSSIAEAKRQTMVGQCLAECRILVADGNTKAAAERLRAARAEYPNDSRLEQYESTLEKGFREGERREERNADKAALSSDLRKLDAKLGRAGMRSVLEHSYNIRLRHPDDPEIGRTVAEIETAIKHQTGLEDLSALLHGDEDASNAKTRLSPRGESHGNRNGGQAVARQREPEPQPEPAKNDRRPLPLIWIGAGLAAVVVVASIGLFVWHLMHRVQSPVQRPVVKQFIPIKLDPPDSLVMSAGKPASERSFAEGTTLEISRPGYKTAQVRLQQQSDGNIVLAPEPIHISVHTAEKDGQVQLDGTVVGELSNGSLDDYTLAADGKTHKLTLVGHRKQPLFSFEFRATPGAIPPVTAADPGSFFIAASLDKNVTLYGPNSGPSFHFADQNISSSPSGASLEIAADKREVKFGEGSEQGSLLFEIANAPALLVHSLTAEGRLLITANVPTAVLTMDGTAIPSHKGRWVITDVTGQHQFAMSADGYKPETWTAILQRGQTSAKLVVLQPIIETPKQATLAIRNGTPGAEVFLKGQRVGELDSNGNLELHDALSKGTYKLTMRKAYYEDREIEVVATGDSREVTPQGNMALTPWPTLSFQTHIPGARVTFWRVDTPGPKHEVGATQKNPLPAGTYAISATAAGYEDFATTVTLNKDVEVPLAFTAIHDYELQDPNQVTREGEWLKAKKKDVALRPGVLHVFLTFTRPGKQQFGNKKVEWFVVSPDRQQRVHYTLEGSKLHRELQVGGGVSGASDLTADVRAGGEQAVVGVVVTVEGDRIRIYNEQRKTLDDFTAPTAEFGDGSIVVRTDTLFRIRRDEQ